MQRKAKAFSTELAAMMTLFTLLLPDVITESHQIKQNNHIFAIPHAGHGVLTKRWIYLLSLLNDGHSGMEWHTIMMKVDLAIQTQKYSNTLTAWITATTRILKLKLFFCIFLLEVNKAPI